MKSCYLLGILILATLLAQAQGENGSPRSFMPPEAIQDRFWDHFPDADAPDWRATETQYVVRFVLNDMHMQAHYSQAGTWKYTDIDVPLDRLPERVRQHYQEHFPHYPLRHIRFHDEEGNSFFQLEVIRDGVTRFLRYDDEGRFIP